MGGDFIHFFQALSDGLSICQSGRYGSGNKTVVVVQFRRSYGFYKFYQIVQLNHFPFVASYVNRFDIGRCITLLAVYLTQNLILFSIHIKIAHTLSAETVLQCFGYITHGGSHCTCLITVNIHSHFRAAELQVHVRHLESRVVIYFA